MCHVLYIALIRLLIIDVLICYWLDTRKDEADEKEDSEYNLGNTLAINTYLELFPANLFSSPLDVLLLQRLPPTCHLLWEILPHSFTLHSLLLLLLLLCIWWYRGEKQFFIMISNYLMEWQTSDKDGLFTDCRADSYNNDIILKKSRSLDHQQKNYFLYWQPVRVCLFAEERS